MSITEREAFWVNVMRLVRAEKKQEIRKKWQLGRLAVMFSWRSRRNLMGRFGGGWNWCLGFDAGGRTIIFNLLVCSIRIELKSRVNA
jgi:hypothetical protein